MGENDLGLFALFLHQLFDTMIMSLFICFIGRKETVRLMRTDPRLTETTIYLQSNNKTNEIIKIM